LKENTMISLTEFSSHGNARVADLRVGRRSLSTVVATVLALAVLALAPVIADRQHDDSRWIGTWSASPQQVAAPIQINGQTVRQIVHTSVGGTRMRVRLSNAYGTRPVVVGSAHVALSGGGSSFLIGEPERTGDATVLGGYRR
jgi:hypothetical protein